MKVHVADFEKLKGVDASFLKAFTQAIEDAHADAAKLLPFGSQHVNFFVQPSRYVIEETGLNAFTVNSEFITINFDEALKLDTKTILDNIRPMIFHEMSHAARFNLLIWHETALDMCLFEGLATVFEREYADWSPPWGEYDSKVVKTWVKEVSKLPDGGLGDEYRFKHPDGRRWISYKVGTYIVEEAMRHSGKTVIELLQLECSDIIDLSQVLKPAT